MTIQTLSHRKSKYSSPTPNPLRLRKIKILQPVYLQDLNGGSHEHHLRTRFTQYFDVAVLQDDWNENSVLLHPGSLRRKLLKQVLDAPTFRLDSSKHVLEIAHEWEQQIATNQHISSVYIADQVGVTSGRVRQIIRLTNLHLDVQRRILELVKTRGIKVVPERLLRQLQKIPQAKQMQQLEHLLAIQ